MLQTSDSVPLLLAKKPSIATRLVPERSCRWVAFCVARDFGLELSDLFGPTRGAPRVAFARQVAMYLAHVGFELSFATISRVFDRDPTTVSHACHLVEEGRDEFRLDLRLEALELFCRAGWSALLQTTPGFGR
jgi:hypothetical protein